MAIGQPCWIILSYTCPKLGLPWDLPLGRCWAVEFILQGRLVDKILKNNGCLSRACVRVNVRGVPIADADYVIDVPGYVFLYYKSKMPT